MANKHYRDSVTQAAANTLVTKEIPLKFPIKPNGKQANAYRIAGIHVQIDDFDAIADGDWWKLQLSYDDVSAFDTIDSKDEIVTVGEDFKVLGTNGPIVKNARQVAQSGVLFVDGKDFLDVFVVKNKIFAVFNTNGQDAAEAAHFELIGNYVTLGEADLREIERGTSLV
jgi:hypothetical protein